MKPRHLLTAIAAAALALPLSFVGGCASGANDKGEQASETIQSVAAELKTTRDRVVSTLTNLNALTTTKEGDLRPKFRAYSESIDSLASAAKTVDTRATKMKEKGDAYFADWDAKIAEINNEDIKAQSQARREEVRARLARISTLYQDAKKQFQPFMTDLRDIRAALNTDLTQAGVAAIDPSVKKAVAEGAAVRGTIENLIKEFESLGVQMSSQAGGK